MHESIYGNSVVKSIEKVIEIDAVRIVERGMRSDTDDIDGDWSMEELLRTNDIVLISFVEALLRDAGITAMVTDQNMSVIEGSLGILPRRVLVVSDQIEEARGILKEAGIGGELEKPKP
jgi:hypothetical protein